MNILWDDTVYPFIEISEVANAPYRVSDSFIEAVKNVIDKLFPPNLCKNDGTKILIIEKDTAIMGDLFFAHVDQVSRKLFDLSSIQEKFNSAPMPSHLLTKYIELIFKRFLIFNGYFSAYRNFENYNTVYADASTIILSKFIFFSASTFSYHRQFHNKKERLLMAIEYLVTNQLIDQASDKLRFIKGAHRSYALFPPNQIESNDLSIKALAELNLSINDYKKIWELCLLPTAELSAKIEKSAINHINLHLKDYISIIHRLGNVYDPIAQEILKPGLSSGQIGIDFNSNIFSLEPEHIIHFENNDDILKQLNKLCFRATNRTLPLSNNTTSSMIDNYVSSSTISGAIKTSVPLADNYVPLQTERDISLNECDQLNIFKEQTISNEGGKPNSNVNMFSLTTLDIFLLKLMLLI
ncbi:unnamed protein product [Rotaria sp. Silwood1]|nr:unnamed protein product [Rotaria sp. Silwood1]